MNRLSQEKRSQIISVLVEGNSLRATARICDVAFNTVLKLVPEIGKACAEYQDKALRNLPCKRLQLDEIWSFCYSKAKNVPDDLKGKFGIGDVWTFTAICADTKLVPSWLVGKRDVDHAFMFTTDLAGRLANRPQITSDGHRMYLDAVEGAFGTDVDFGMLIKLFNEPKGKGNEKRYSPGECCGIKKSTIIGNPDPRHLSTSFVERQNGTMRQCMKRFARLSNGFSKKIENHNHSIALHYMHYNFCRIHKSLRVTPAMAANVTDHLWSVEDIAALLEK